MEANHGADGRAHAMSEVAPDILRECAARYLCVGDVSQCCSVCTQWHALSAADEWVHTCILHGNVDSAERRGLWGRLAKVSNLQDRWCAKLIHEAVPGLNGTALNSDGSFEALATHPLPTGKLSEIERDVTRTLPQHPRFFGDAGSSGRQDLLKVLRATAVAEPNVGYCQGMNFVAAVLLITLGSAHDAFWMLLALLDGYHYRRIFAPGVPLLPLRIFQFSALVRERLPRLWRHLHVECSSVEIFAHQCVMTLFAYSIEPGILACVWDAFFLMGWKAVFQVGLGLLARLEGKLLSMDIEQISIFLHQCKRHIDVPKDPDKDLRAHARQVLEALFRFDISGESLASLESSFQQERWRQLLDLAASGGLQDRRPLPTGIERAPCGTGVTLDIRAMSSENRPPWQRTHNSHSEPAEDESEAAPVVVPLDDLKALRQDLETFDSQTQSDAVAFQHRIFEAEKQVSAFAREIEPLRQEVLEMKLECEEGRLAKKALMDSLQVAVKTSSSVRNDAPMLKNGDSDNHLEDSLGEVSANPSPSRTDAVVVECLSRLNKVESELFEKTRRHRELEEELSPAAEDLSDLQENKARAMAQLQAFLNERQEERAEMLATGMQRLLRAKREATAEAAQRTDVPEVGS